MISHDAWGIAHIRTDTVERLAYEQGWLTARERTGQLKFEHRRATATTAEVMGEAGAAWDDFSRRAELAPLARRAYDALPDEDRAFVAAYADGVRAAGTIPDWQPWSSLGVFAVQQVLFASFPGKLWRQHVIDTLGLDAAELFRTEGQPQGSNAFVVGRHRSVSGQPLVAGDPHRLFERPNVYQQIRLSAEEFDVAGYCFPGVPGVQHFAHAGSVAWGITNGMADYQDLVLDDPDAGPLIIDGPPLHLRTASWVLGDLGFAALLPLLRSRTADDVEAAFGHWVEPVNNLVVADDSGAVRHVVVGKVPQRTHDGSEPIRSGPHGWSGWVDLPRREGTADSALVTANDRAWADFDRIGDTFAPPFRANRIRELLAEQPVDASRASAVLCDVRQNGADRLLELVAAQTDLSPSGATARADLLAWDRDMAPDSTGAALLTTVRDAVVDQFVEALQALADLPAHADFYAPWFLLASRIQDSLHVILAAESPFGLAPRDVVRRALDAAPTERPTWGERHRFTALTPAMRFGQHDDSEQPERASGLPGDNHCVFSTGSVPASDLSIRGPVARYAWDLAGWEHSGWITPLGRQHDLWIHGEFVPLVRDWDQLTVDGEQP